MRLHPGQTIWASVERAEAAGVAFIAEGGALVWVGTPDLPTEAQGAPDRWYHRGDMYELLIGHHDGSGGRYIATNPRRLSREEISKRAGRTRYRLKLIKATGSW